jgi:hypothetical protein
MNSWQQPIEDEPGGATWHKVANPGTGWFASKTSSWVADRFSDTPTDCLTVDFSSVVPAGTRAVKVALLNLNAGNYAYWRPGGDANVSNTPNASQEYAFRLPLWVLSDSAVVELWLSATYTVDIAVLDTNQDIYVAYPVEYLL